MGRMSDQHVNTTSDRADNAEREAAFLQYLINDLTTKAKVVTDAYEAADGVMVGYFHDDLINQLRKATDDARTYIGPDKAAEEAFNKPMET